MGRVLAISLLLFSQLLPAATDPSEITVKVLALYLSKDVYCSSPIEVFTTAEPGFVDFLGGPTIGQLDNSKYLYDGTYRCAIVKMSETVKFVPILGSGACTAGNRFETSFCGAGVTTTAVDGSTSACTAGSDDAIYVYLSTASTATTLATSANPFAPPTATSLTNGLVLSSSILINGEANLRLIVNAFGKIGSASGTCAINDLVINLAL